LLLVIVAEELPDLDSPPDTRIELIVYHSHLTAVYLLLSDPNSSGVNDLLQGWILSWLCECRGLASGSRRWVVGLACFVTALGREGTVGVALSGNIRKQLWPADADHLSLPGKQRRTEYPTELSRSKPLEVLWDLIQSLSESDRQLAQHSLFVGVARDEFKQNLEQG